MDWVWKAQEEKPVECTDMLADKAVKLPRAENEQLHRERDIFKKGVAVFSTDPGRHTDSHGREYSAEEVPGTPYCAKMAWMVVCCCAKRTNAINTPDCNPIPEIENRSFPPRVAPRAIATMRPRISTTVIS